MTRKRGRPRKHRNLSKRYARLLLTFIFFAVLFLFYPGDSFYIQLFSENAAVFLPTRAAEEFQIHPVPILKNNFYTPQVFAGGVYIMDLDSKTPVYEKNSTSRFLPASTAKVMTALVAADHFKMNDILEVKRVISEGQVVGVVPGERFELENVLYGLLVYSGNDMAFVIADNYPGGEKAFVTAMNEKAAELGMTNTHFQNPAGLDAADQYTTPFDLSLAGRKLLENPVLSHIVSTKSITISDVDFNHFYSLSNINKLLGEIPGVGGLKTGYTDNAGENLITFYKKNGHQFLIVILKSSDRFADTKQIVNWIDANVEYIHL